jgi:hypothetical protein
MSMQKREELLNQKMNYIEDFHLASELMFVAVSLYLANQFPEHEQIISNDMKNRLIFADGCLLVTFSLLSTGIRKSLVIVTLLSRLRLWFCF